jgi:2-dehydropantoate 2-reductase
VSRVAIVGPGAVGSVLAAVLLVEGEHDVIVCARTPFTALEVSTPAGVLRASPRVLASPVAAEAVDWVVLATKAYDVDGAAAWLAPLGADRVGGARVAVVQNGVEHVARLASYVPMERVVPVVADLPAERRGAGSSWLRRAGSLTVPDDDGGRAFAALLAGTSISTSTTGDFTTAAWRKLCVNAAAAVSVLTMRPAGVSRRPAVAALMRAIVAEAVAVGRAEGAALPSDLPDAIVRSAQAAPPELVNSMLADRLAGRRLELDARNGAVVRFGARHGVPTPMNALVVELIAASVDA